jgi:hemerythrin-like domain-containing protein
MQRQFPGYRNGDVLALITGMALVPREARSIRSLLLQEHLQLEVLFDCLLAAVELHATGEVAGLWSAFDVRLRAHLELEERYLIPAFGQDHPDDATRLLAEHDRIRASLQKLGAAFDRPPLSRAGTIARFAELLRLHAAHEDQLLYPWAEQNIEAEASSKMLERFLGRSTPVPSGQVPS